NPDSVVIDSIVLAIPFSSLYGDSNSVQQFEVYQIDPGAGFQDSLYEINTAPFSVLPGVLGSKLVNFSTLNDSVHYVNFTSTSSTVTDTVGTTNLLRIQLDTAFGRQFLNFDTATQYKTDSAFFSQFKGL